MMNAIQSLIAFLGRALLSIIFISSAVFKIFDWQETLQSLIQAMSDWLAVSIGRDLLQQSLEWGLDNASFLLGLAIVFELLGGLMVFLGLWIRLGALLLLFFIIPVTFVFHHFWELQGAERMQQMMAFMKNVGICGGLLVLIAYGSRYKSDHQHDKSAKEN